MVNRTLVGKSEGNVCNGRMECFLFVVVSIPLSRFLSDHSIVSVGVVLDEDCFVLSLLTVVFKMAVLSLFLSVIDKRCTQLNSLLYPLLY